MLRAEQGGIFVLYFKFVVRDVCLASLFGMAFFLAYADVHTGIVSFFVTDNIVGHPNLLSLVDL